jgi:hypothetical protein
MGMSRPFHVDVCANERDGPMIKVTLTLTQTVPKTDDPSAWLIGRDVRLVPWPGEWCSLGDVHTEEDWRQCRCNQCGATFSERYIAIQLDDDGSWDEEYCPVCGDFGCIMDEEGGQ